LSYKLHTLLAVLTLTFSAITIVIRELPLSNNVSLVIAVGAPYAALVALLGLALSVMCRRVVLSAVAVGVVAVTLAIQLPWYYFGQPPVIGEHVDIRVLSSNLRKGRADASSFVALARSGADVVTVSELTPEEVQRFSAAGIEAAFPYAALVPGPGAGGIGLWSRFPVAVLPVAEHEGTAIVVARLRIPGVRVDPVVGSVHVTSALVAPRESFGDWRTGITAVKRELDGFAAAGSVPVIVAGDFNSTSDMRQFRDLLTNGYHDAVEQIGAGFTPTFPSYKGFPPLITIDHMLTRHAAASSIRTIGVRGSDHRSLLATVDVPLNPTTS
jgi:endonuclease/exonuclease/phosphatase (EEP) superfamily protein YafD